MMLYVFGDFALNVRLHALQRGREVIRLGPKVFSVLVYLVRHRDRVVFKQELCEHLWPEQYVSEAALARCIASLRRALGDTGEGQHLIQTLYGQGYRFVAPVEASPLLAQPLIVGLPLPVDSVSLRTLAGFAHKPSPTSASAEAPWDSLGSLSSLVEHHEVTVLCGSVVYSPACQTALSPGRHDVEHWIFALVHDAVLACGGMIHSFLDETFVALFGMAAEQAAHACLAAQAARLVQHSLASALAQCDHKPAALRLALHSGPVIGYRVGKDRRVRYTGIGDTLRLALRLQALADPGVLLISALTLQYLDAAGVDVPAVAFGSVGASA